MSVRELRLPGDWIVLVDQEDYERLARFRWHVTDSGTTVYATRNISRAGGLPQRSVTMHRDVLGEPPEGLEIDHVHHPPLSSRTIDNCRANLRFVTRAQNSANMRKFRGTSVFKGVSLHKASGLWRATLRIGGKHHNVGYFHCEGLAAYAYDLAAVDARGPYALTNFPVPGSLRSIYG